MNLYEKGVRSGVSAFIIAIGIFGCLPNDALGDDLETSIDALLSRFDRSDAPGLAVGVVKEGGILYAKGWGLADLEHAIPLTPDSVFDIASVSKQFAGLAIAMLEDEGKLMITDPIRDHVSGLPEVFAPVQLLHLLHHTSGIRDWPGALVLGGRRFDDVITFQDILALARRQEALSFVPGEMYSYSNTGYNLLARTVETVTGTDFSDWMQARVFLPLEMTSTHFYKDHNAVVENRVRSYTGSFDGPFQNVGDQLTALGSSSLYSSVNDLLKWIIHFDQPTITAASVIDKIMTPGRLNSGQSAKYGYGLGVGHFRGALRISHSGGWAGFRTYLLYYPRFKIGVVVLSNWGGANVSELADQVAAEVVQGQWPSPSNDPVDEAVVGAGERLDVQTNWLGDYFINNNPSSKVKLFRRNGRLWVQLPNDHGYSLKTGAYDVFYSADRSIKILGSQGPNGWPRSLWVKTPDWTGTAKEGPVQAFEDGEGETYEGVYESSELLTNYHVQFEEGELVVRHHRHDPVRLSRFGKDRFTSGTWYWSRVDFDRDFQGEVTALRVSQSRNRNMLFRKVR
ncbi:MAG: serine hydrolase [Verrucomicrobia bacterium]|nr:serine hydrolase [Verrucomicrobiota bacterium]